MTSYCRHQVVLKLHLWWELAPFSWPKRQKKVLNILLLAISSPFPDRLSSCAQLCFFKFLFSIPTVSATTKLGLASLLARPRSCKHSASNYSGLAASLASGWLSLRSPDSPRHSRLWPVTASVCGQLGRGSLIIMAPSVGHWLADHAALQCTLDHGLKWKPIKISL